MLSNCPVAPPPFARRGDHRIFFMATPPDPLDPLFARWRADTPTLPRSVTSEVWSRIEHAEHARSSGQSVLARIELAFSRPAFAASFIAACVLLGLFLAET